MKKLSTFLIGVAIAIALNVYGASVYNLFSPGGALSGTWNSQNVDLTATGFLTGPLGVPTGGTGVATLTGLALGNGATAMSAYPGTSCTNQFPRSLNASGAATCSAVSLTADVSGILPIANGGNGTSTPTANPTGTVGLTAVNGTATTYLRSDSAPQLSQAIAPTWTGNHTFSPSSGVAIAVNGVAGVNVASQQITGANVAGQSNGLFILAGVNSTADRPLDVLSQNGGTRLIGVFGDGSIITGGQALKGSGTINAGGIYSAGTQLLPILSATTGSIGGGALLAGQCSSGTVTITGATTSMVALADPQTYPGDGTIWDALITSANTATVKICAIIALTPTASLYNVRVLQ